LPFASIAACFASETVAKMVIPNQFRYIQRKTFSSFLGTRAEWRGCCEVFW